MTKSIATVLLLLVVGMSLVACKGAPGANGEYATHDHGYLNRGP